MTDDDFVAPAPWERQSYVPPRETLAYWRERALKAEAEREVWRRSNDALRNLRDGLLKAEAERDAAVQAREVWMHCAQRAQREREALVRRFPQLKVCDD